MTNSNSIYTLEKRLWTELDFETMGWHDSFIYAISLTENFEFILDIDYIFNWVNPEKDTNYYKFWVSPCTLVFENVYSLKFDFEISVPFELEISDVTRSNPHKALNAAFIDRETEYDWTIDVFQGEITFKSIGYKQYVRQNPILLDKQKIGLNERKGIMFDRSVV